MVYFVQSGPDPSAPIKIGYVEAGRGLTTRMTTLQTGNPERLYVLATLPSAGPKTERWLHKAFASYRIRSDGEWFHFDEALRKLVEDVSVDPESFSTVMEQLRPNCKPKRVGRPSKKSKTARIEEQVAAGEIIVSRIKQEPLDTPGTL